MGKSNELEEILRILEFLEKDEELGDLGGMSSYKTFKDFYFEDLRYPHSLLLLCCIRSLFGNMMEMKNNVWMRAEHARYHIQRRNRGFKTYSLL